MNDFPISRAILVGSLWIAAAISGSGWLIALAFVMLIFLGLVTEV